MSEPFLHNGDILLLIHLGQPVPFRRRPGPEESEVPATGPDNLKGKTPC